MVQHTGELLGAVYFLFELEKEAPTLSFWPSDTFENEPPIRGEEQLLAATVAEPRDAASVCLRPRSEPVRGFKITLLVAADVEATVAKALVALAVPTDWGADVDEEVREEATADTFEIEEVEAERSEPMQVRAPEDELEGMKLSTSSSSSSKSP